MLKKIFLVFAFITITSSPSLLADEGDLSFGLDLGGVGFVGDGMTVYGANGFGYGAFLTYAPSELFDLDLNFVYSPHKSNGNEANAFYGTIGLKFGMTFDQLMPYLTAGVGFYRNSIGESTINGTTYSSTYAASFGFNFGGGVDIDVGRYMRLGLLVRYHPVLGKDLDSGRKGVNDYWDALLRVGFLFRTGIQGCWD